MSITLEYITDDITQVFGIPTFDDAPPFIQSRVLNDINKAIQEVQQAGEDYYGRETITVPLAADQESYELDELVQTVLEPVKLSDGTLLKKLTSRGQLGQFGQLFLDQLDNQVFDAYPLTYYVESTKRNDATFDEVDITLHLAPKPSAAAVAAVGLLVPVIRQPTALTMADLVAGTSMLPIPHKYVESIFLPMARWNATTSFLFYEKEKIPRYEMEYLRALKLLGFSDPRRPKPPESRSDALDTEQPSAQAPISPVQKQPK